MLSTGHSISLVAPHFTQNGKNLLGGLLSRVSCGMKLLEFQIITIFKLSEFSERAYYNVYIFPMNVTLYALCACSVIRFARSKLSRMAFTVVPINDFVRHLCFSLLFSVTV